MRKFLLLLTVPLMFASCGTKTQENGQQEEEVIEEEVAIVDSVEVVETPTEAPTPTPVVKEKKWEGASSLDELKERIKDTRWYAIDDDMGGYVMQLEFYSNGKACHVKKSPLSNEHWVTRTFPIEFTIERGSDGNMAVIEIGKNANTIPEFEGLSVCFEPGGAKRAVLMRHNNVVGGLKFGVYKFDDNI